eukprot:scaffold262851_cov30-Tisochrysis_lutea.AAC.3
MIRPFSIVHSTSMKLGAIVTAASCFPSCENAALTKRLVLASWHYATPGRASPTASSHTATCLRDGESARASGVPTR